MLSRFWPILLWLIYLISPIDLFPDTIFGPGFIDDALLLWLLYWFLWRKPAPQNVRDQWARARNQGPSGGTGGSSDQEQTKRNSRTESDRARDPYAILEIDRNATFDEIRKAYHLQAGRYHPDKVSHLGEEFQSLANRKFQDIQWAYQTLAKTRGKA